jgi:hypothetical protein
MVADRASLSLWRALSRLWPGMAREPCASKLRSCAVSSWGARTTRPLASPRLAPGSAAQGRGRSAILVTILPGAIRCIAASAPMAACERAGGLLGVSFLTSGRDKIRGLILDSRVVIGQVWRNRLFIQAFPGGATDAASLEKAVSYQVLKSCTGCVRPRNPT